MNILFLTHYFPPEVGAPQTRIFELASALQRRGHQVTILAPFPHYPSGHIPEEFRGKRFSQETMDGLEVIRTWVYATPNRGFIKRIANHLSFMLSSALLGPSLISRQDIMVVESPPLFTGMAGIWLKRLWRTPYIFNVADLWPESAIALGALNNPLAIKLAQWQERFLYSQSARITAVTMGIRERLLEQGQPDNKVAWLPNGVDIDFFNPTIDQREARQKLGWPQDKIIATYGGTHGLAQGLDTILQAADLLRHRVDTLFIMVGDGADKNRLINMKETLNLSNVMFMESQPKSQMPTVLAATDLSLVVLKDLPLFRGALPSKMYEAMAMQRPILLGVAGEAEQLIQQAQAGLCVQPENPAALANAIDHLANHPDERHEFGKNGRIFVTENFRRDLLADRLEVLLQETLDQNECQPA